MERKDPEPKVIKPTENMDTYIMKDQHNPQQIKY